MRFLSAVRQHLATPRQRIIFALGLSVLIHLVLLGVPHIEAQQAELNLPPLIAKLEALPKQSRPQLAAEAALPKDTPTAIEPILPNSAPLPASAVKKTDPASTPEVIAEITPVASAVAASSAVEIASEPAAVISAVTAAPEVAVSAPAIEIEPQRPVLPKQARLQFDVFQGKSNFKVGEAIHTLQINDGHYVLQADMHTTGFAGMLKSYRMDQISSGSASKYTLKPDLLTEEVNDSKGTQRNRTEFDWNAHRVRFSAGGDANLPAHAQDILSILYQFPTIKPGTEIVSIYIATSKMAEEYRFEIGFEEQLSTPFGELKTVHFRKLHKPDQEGLEIWFAQEYRLLPVKIRHIDSSGKVAGEAVITDIRVAD